MKRFQLPSIHTDSIITCSIHESKKLILTGGEDGLLSFVHPSSNKAIDRISKDDPCTSIACSPIDDYTICFSINQSVLHLDLRKSLNQDSIVNTYTINNDEINSISIDNTGKWVAAADDTGEIQVISLLQQSSDTTNSTTKKPQYKTLRRGHTNIASAVAFRRNKPAEQLISGGLDCTLVKWDYTRLKQLHSWNINTENIAHQESGKICNPPMVHHIATPSGMHSDSLVNRVFAVARGDGFVSLYDGDGKGYDASTGSKSKRSSGSGIRCSNNIAQRPLLLWYSSPADQGGHSGAVNDVSFLPNDETCLVSVGNDTQVCVWKYLNSEDDGSPLVGHIKHTAKINCVAGVPLSVSGQYDAVFGDVNGKLSCISLQ